MRLSIVTIVSCLVSASPALALAQGAEARCRQAELVQLDASPLIDAVVARLGTSDALATGAAGDAVARVFVGAVCAASYTRAALPATCAPVTEAQVLLALRRRLIVDAVSRPAVWLGRRLAALSPGEQLGARLGLALLDASLREPSLRGLGASLAGRAWACAGMEFPSIAPGIAVPRAAGDAGVEAIGRVLQALAWGAEGTADEARQALRDELSRQGRLATGAALSATRASVETELLALLPGLQAELRSLAALRGQARAERLPAVVVLLGRSLELVATYTLDESAPSISPFVAVVEALAQGSPSELVPRLGAVLPAGARLTGPERRGLEALGVGLRLVSVRDRREAERILRELVLGPWAAPWMVDLGGLALSVSDRGTRLGGQLLLGYQTERLGLAVQGRLGSYDLDDGRRIAQTDRVSGGLDSWMSLGSNQTRFDLRLSTEIARYKTTRADRLAAADETFFFSETSILARGSLLPGVRVEPSPTLAFGLWAGAGLQYESHRPISLGSSQGISLENTHSTSVSFQGRLRGQANVWPDVLALRAAIDAVHFRVTTDSLRTTLTVQQGTTQEATSQRGAQTEVNARVFLDAEVFRFLGFVPGLLGGVDAVIFRGKDRSASTVVPAIGAGVRRTSF